MSEIQIETLAAILARLERIESIVGQLYDHENPVRLIDEIGREHGVTWATQRLLMSLPERAKAIQDILDQEDSA